jgi:hypothetical protein
MLDALLPTDRSLLAELALRLAIFPSSIFYTLRRQKLQKKARRPFI